MTGTEPARQSPWVKSHEYMNGTDVFGRGPSATSLWVREAGLAERLREKRRYDKMLKKFGWWSAVRGLALSTVILPT
jgi:hypothetical protein